MLMSKQDAEDREIPESETGCPEEGARSGAEADEVDREPQMAAPDSTTEPESEAPDAEVEEEKEEDLESVLERARAEAAENYDRFLRATAELDNYRKRTAKVRTETRTEALREALLQIAPILDNLRRALSQEDTGGEAFKQGVELIYSQFQEMLRGYGLEELEALGQPFDPNLHEAMMEVEHDQHPPGTVVEEMDKGYKLNNKVVRHTRVIVSKAGGDNG